MRTLLRCSVWLALVVFGCDVYAQLQCSGTSGLLSKGTLDANGVRHIKINMPSVGTGAGQVTQGTRDALVQALLAWNAETGTTRVQFDPVSSGGDFTVSRNNAAIAAAGKVCGLRSGTNVYIDDYLNGLGSNPTAQTAGKDNSFILQYMFSHEFGHVLNLAEYSGGPSIMNGGDPSVNPPPTTCQGVVTTAWPQNNGIIESADAVKAKECANKLDEVENPDEGFGSSNPNESCWDVYWVSVWFTMNHEGEWELVGYTWTFLYTTCEGDPYPEG